MGVGRRGGVVECMGTPRHGKKASRSLSCPTGIVWRGGGESEPAPLSQRRPPCLCTPRGSVSESAVELVALSARHSVARRYGAVRGAALCRVDRLPVNSSRRTVRPGASLFACVKEQ